MQIVPTIVRQIKTNVWSAHCHLNSRPVGCRWQQVGYKARRGNTYFRTVVLKLFCSSTPIREKKFIDPSTSTRISTK